MGPGPARRPVRQGDLGAGQPRAVDTPRGPGPAPRRGEIPPPGGSLPGTWRASPRRTISGVDRRRAARSRSRRCSCSTTTRSGCRAWPPRKRHWRYAHEAGVVCTDEILLHPDPYPSREAWCCGPAGGDRAAAGGPRPRPADRAGQPLPAGPRAHRICATRSSRSGAVPTGPPTGTGATEPRVPSTGTCTSPGPPGTTASASRRYRSATRASGTVGTPARDAPPGARVRRWVAPTGAAALRDVADRGPSFHRDQAKEDLHLPRANGPRKSVRVDRGCRLGERAGRLPAWSRAAPVSPASSSPRAAVSGGVTAAGGGGNLQLLHCDAGMATLNQGNQTVRGNQYTRSRPPERRSPHTSACCAHRARCQPDRRDPLTWVKGAGPQLVPKNDQGPASDVSETGPYLRLSPVGTTGFEPATP